MSHSTLSPALRTRSRSLGLPLIALGALLASGGCSMFKVISYGFGASPEPTAGADEASTDTAPEDDILHVQVPADLSEPRVVSVDSVADQQRIRLTAAEHRGFWVQVFGASSAFDHPWDDLHYTRGPLWAEPQPTTTDRGVDIRIHHVSGPVELVFVEKDAQPGAFRVTEPLAADASVRARSIQRNMSTAEVRAIDDEPILKVQDTVDQMPADLFVFASTQIPCVSDEPIDAGEPLLLWEDDPARSVIAIRANGRRCWLAPEQLESLSSRPSGDITLPRADHPGFGDTARNYWADKQYYPLTDDDPRVTEVHALRAAKFECKTAEWAKVDPDKTSRRYDVVSYDRRGNVKNVESLTSKLYRKIKKTCRVDELDAARERVRAQAVAEWDERHQSRMTTLRQRLASR